MLDEWQVAYLLKPKVSRQICILDCTFLAHALKHKRYSNERTLQDSLAMWLPAEVTSDEGCSAATHLCLEFWRGSVSLGIYMLPLADIRQALAGQVREAWTCGIVYKCINLTPFLHCTTNLSGMYDRLVGFQGVKKPKVRRSGLFRRKLQPEPKSQLPQRTKLAPACSGTQMLQGHSCSHVHACLDEAVKAMGLFTCRARRCAAY